MFVIMNFMYVKVFASILLIFMLNNDGGVNSHSVLEQPDIIKRPEKPYIFHPEDNRIEVDEGDGFTISFEEVSNKTRLVYCYYESATIRGNYVINRQFEDITTTYKPYPYNQDHLYPSEIDDVEQFLKGPDNQPRDKRIPHRKKGDPKAKTEFDDKEFHVPERNSGPNALKTDATTCGFVLGHVNSRAPRFWTITAFDSYTNKNYTENVTIHFYYSAPMAYKEVIALSGSSYFNYLKLDPKVPIKNCVLTHNGMLFDLDLYDNSEQIEYDMEWKGLGDGRCGYYVTEAKMNNPPNLTLRVIGKDKKNYRNSSYITVIDKTHFFKNREIYTTPTENIIVHCGLPFDPVRLQSPERFCNLYNPQGILVHAGDSCNYHIEHVTLEDFGVWTCHVGASYSMDTLHYNTTLKPHTANKELEVETYVMDSGKYFSLTCELKNYRVTNQTVFCKFTRPDGEIFTTYEGAASSSGYLSHSTNLYEGICGIDIQKPGQYADKGTWKCEINTLGFKTGGFIDFTRATTPKLLQEASPRPVPVGGRFKVKCAVGFSAKECYIISPNGTHYQSEDQYAWFVGECGLRVRYATATDNGTWTCFFVRDDSSVDYGVKVNITVADTAENENTVITTVYHKKFTIKCFSSDIPLDYCRISSPHGKGYSFNGSRTTISDHSTHMTLRYIGEGLDFGDCIVEIGNISNSVAGGVWTCSFKMSNIETTFSHTYSVVVYFDDRNVIRLMFSGMGIVLVLYFVAFVAPRIFQKCCPGAYARWKAAMLEKRRVSDATRPERESGRISRSVVLDNASNLLSQDETTVEQVTSQGGGSRSIRRSPEPGPSTALDSTFAEQIEMTVQESQSLLNTAQGETRF